MTEHLPLLLVGALGVLAAFVERRDGWRHVALAERLDRELADVRERLALLERAREDGPTTTPTEPRPWWAFWRNR